MYRNYLFVSGGLYVLATCFVASLSADYEQDTEPTVDDLTSSTHVSAPDGTTPDTRTTIGLGEKVDITLDSSSWSDTDENLTTGMIEDDTIGDRVWAASSGGSISPSGVTQVDEVTLTAGFDPDICAVVCNVYDSETKYDDDYITKSIVFTIIAPSGEVTAFDSWVGRVARFSATLQPTSVCFGAISVTEVDGMGAQDDCWFVGSAQTKYEALTGGTWDVDNNNYWEFDHLAWADADITYYRANPVGAVRAPCQTNLPQEMHVVEGNSGQYDGSTLEIRIGTTTVGATRDGVSRNRTYTP